jgi:AraC-like DNA-binding protein
MKVVNEHVQHPDQSFRLLRFELGSFGLERHRHPHWELTWIEQGSGVRLVSENASPFTSGDMVLLAGNLPHTWKSLKSAGAIKQVATVLQFPGELLDIAALPELAQLRPLMLLARRGASIGGEAQQLVARHLQEMHTKDALGKVLGLYDILRCLSLHMGDLKPVANLAYKAMDHPAVDSRIDFVLQWIHANIGSQLQMQDAAALAHVSSGAFSRFFRRETGKTYTNFVNDVRCAQACALLSESSLPVSTIATDCGFETNSNFNRQFLARLGVTPRAYRKAG